MTVRVYGPGNVLAVYRMPGRVPLAASGHAGSTWRGRVPSTADYLVLVGGNGECEVTFEIPPLQAESRSEPLRRVRFARGAISATVYYRARPSVVGAFVLEAARGQQMTVRVRGNGRVLHVTTRGGRTVDAEVAVGRTWSGRLPLTGDYVVAVTGDGECEITFEIPP